MGTRRTLRSLEGPSCVLTLLVAEAARAEAAGAPALSFWGKLVLVAALIAVGVIAMRRGGDRREP